MLKRSQLVIVQTTFESEQEAQTMAQGLVSQKLAACVHLNAVESFYEWNDSFCQTKEYTLQIKTIADFYDEVEAFILENHSYDTPEILLFKIEKSSLDYAQWVEETLSLKP